MELSNFFLEHNNRIFIFQSVDIISNEHTAYLKDRLNNQFFKNWFSHNQKLNAKLLVLFHHFIIISVSESSISGCSIDSLNREMKIIELELNIKLFDRKKIGYYVSSDKNTNIIDNLNPVDICFLNYRDFIDNFSICHQTVFIFDNTIIKSHDTWIIPFNIWCKKYIKI